jgi:tetratricopeptide (TPR) repeat protein
MRMIAALIAGSLLLVSLPEPLAAIESGADSSALTPDASGPGTSAPDRATRLDRLFAALRDAKSEDAAKEAETDIIQLWLQSGSDTVDLLMTWTLQAIEEKDYSLALDFLDRITILKPDYAEGWNKRATVYFLLDDYEKSISDIGHTLALEPRHFGALSGLGTMMRELGDEKHAIAAYKQALAIDPYLDNVKKALGELEKKAAGQGI